MTIFSEVRNRLRPSPLWIAAGYLTPPTLAFLRVALWPEALASWEVTSAPLADRAIGVGIVLLGLLAGVWAGGAATRAADRAAAQAQHERLGDLRHDVRRSLTIIRGEVEVILRQDGIAADERRASGDSVIQEVERVDELLRHQQSALDPFDTAPPRGRHQR